MWDGIASWSQLISDIADVRLQGLDSDQQYQISGWKTELYGDELMQAGLIISDAASGQNPEQYNGENGDFQSRLYLLKAKER